LTSVFEDHQPDPIDIAVGARIRMRRKMLGVSQQGLADVLGVTFQQVQKYERGTNRVSASMLVKIARRLDCTVASLVGEEAGVVDDSLAPTLAVPGALELVDAFARIEDAQVRRRALDLLTALAVDDPGRAASVGRAERRGRGVRTSRAARSR
jgi:transcriptional regulator with XRE-family HTH domain